MTRITGRQARELLEGTTPGPWELLTQDGDPDGIVEAIGPMGAEFPVGTSFYDGPILTGSTEDHRLLAAAPALAETVSWLYGREADAEAVDGTERHWRDQTILTSRGAGALAMFKGNFIGYGDEMTPDEAVDLARALLAAAEEARRG